jgi:4a-hydroxytetrahydrobiopterin dehydratase
MNDLIARRCHPLEGRAAFTAAEIAAHLAESPGWALIDGALQKRFDFPDFHRTMAFVNAVAWIAHVEDHHPDLQVSHGQCAVRFHTHSVRGISINDFICAAKVDVLLP